MSSIPILAFVAFSLSAVAATAQSHARGHPHAGGPPPYAGLGKDPNGMTHQLTTTRIGVERGATTRFCG